MAAKQNTLRIIGGQWRGRKLPFADIEELRPTPDRVRETLFNWMQGAIRDTRCIDLFAGSGALGLEALSRGAAYCLFIDKNNAATARIQQNLETLSCSKGQIVTQDAMRYLRQNPALQQGQNAFDTAFVDPPYAQELAVKCCELLETGNWLNDNARIYIETARPLTQQALPGNWQLYRQKQAGNVCYHLAIKCGSNDSQAK